MTLRELQVVVELFEDEAVHSVESVYWHQLVAPVVLVNSIALEVV